MRVRHLLSLLLVLLLPCSLAWSAEIKKIKAKAVLITNIQTSVGDTVFAIDEGGKKRALIEIIKVNKNVAAGRIKKGRAKVGMKVIPRRGSTAKSGENSTEDQFRETPTKNPSKFLIGGIAGFTMDTIVVTYSGQTVSNSGTGYSLKAIGDYSFGNLLTARATTGYETISAKSSSSSTNCGGSCSTTISYLTFDAIAKFNLMHGSFPLWAGGGVGFAVPMSKSTNNLNADSITTTNIIYLSLGSDIDMGSWILPIQIDYGMFFPQTDEVKSSLIGLRVGALFRF